MMKTLAGFILTDLWVVPFFVTEQRQWLLLFFVNLFSLDFCSGLIALFFWVFLLLSGAVSRSVSGLISLCFFRGPFSPVFLSFYRTSSSLGGGNRLAPPLNAP